MTKEELYYIFRQLSCGDELADYLSDADYEYGRKAMTLFKENRGCIFTLDGWGFAEELTGRPLLRLDEYDAVYDALEELDEDANIFDYQGLGSETDESLPEGMTFSEYLNRKLDSYNKKRKFPINHFKYESKGAVPVDIAIQIDSKDNIIEIADSFSGNADFGSAKLLNQKYQGRNYREVSEQLSSDAEKLAELNLSELEVVEKLVAKGYELSKAVDFKKVRMSWIVYHSYFELGKTYVSEFLETSADIKGCIDYEKLGRKIMRKPEDYYDEEVKLIKTYDNKFYEIYTNLWDEHEEE